MRNGTQPSLGSLVFANGNAHLLISNKKLPFRFGRSPQTLKISLRTLSSSLAADTKDSQVNPHAHPSWRELWEQFIEHASVSRGVISTKRYCWEVQDT